MREYRKAVKASKQEMKESLTNALVKKSSDEARENLRAKTLQRENFNSTHLTQDKNSRLETIRTLEAVETKVATRREQAKRHRESLSMKISKDVERVFYQKSKHQED